MLGLRVALILIFFKKLKKIYLTFWLPNSNRLVRIFSTTLKVRTIPNRDLMHMYFFAIYEMLF